MGTREPVKTADAHEIALLAEVTADTEDLSRAVMAKARYALLHTDFPGRKCISGNLAIPFSPSDIPVGADLRIQHLACHGDRRPARAVPNRDGGGIAMAAL